MYVAQTLGLVVKMAMQDAEGAGEQGGRQPCGLRKKSDGEAIAQGPGTGQTPGQAGIDSFHKQVVWALKWSRIGIHCTEKGSPRGCDANTEERLGGQVGVGGGEKKKNIYWAPAT